MKEPIRTIKSSVYKKIIVYELVSFALIIALIWLDELIDIPYRLLGAEMTPINWRESLLETIIILTVSFAIIRVTKRTLDRVTMLEGLLPICASCKKIRDNSGNWQNIDSYIHKYSGIEFTHGICSECTKKLYPEFNQKQD